MTSTRYHLKWLQVGSEVLDVTSAKYVRRKKRTQQYKHPKNKI
jgi:hypothetical protein